MYHNMSGTIVQAIEQQHGLKPLDDARGHSPRGEKP